MNVKNPLLTLFYASFVILFVGYGLFPFLPLYATEFGATSTTIGVYLALTYAAITVGSVLPGWLPQSLSRKRLFVATGLLGVPALFLALAALWATLPLVIFFKLDEVRATNNGQQTPGAEGAMPSASPGFSLLLVTAVLAAGTASIGSMGTSLSMGTLAFSAAAISSTSSVAGLLMIPFVLLMGTLSDRLGSRRFLTFGHLLTGTGVLILIVATQLWHFWMAMTVMLMGRAIDDAMAPTVAAELLPPAALQHSLPKLKAINWMAGVASFVGAGYAMDRVGTASVFLAASLLALVAALLLRLLPVLEGKTRLTFPFGRPSAAQIFAPCGQGCV